MPHRINGIKVQKQNSTKSLSKHSSDHSLYLRFLFLSSFFGWMQEGSLGRSLSISILFALCTALCPLCCLLLLFSLPLRLWFGSGSLVLLHLLLSCSHYGAETLLQSSANCLFSLLRGAERNYKVFEPQKATSPPSLPVLKLVSKSETDKQPMQSTSTSSKVGGKFTTSYRRLYNVQINCFKLQSATLQRKPKSIDA